MKYQWPISPAPGLHEGILDAPFDEASQCEQGQPNSKQLHPLHNLRMSEATLL